MESQGAATRAAAASVADELIRVVESAATRLHSVSPAESVESRSPGKWTKQEELGHLLDSAVNNHHRFIRAQEVEHLVFPKYEQDSWVSLQAYQDSDWPELIELWRLYNRHLAQVVARIPQEKLGHICTIGPYEPVTLRFLVEDYLAHLKHHLGRIGALT